LVDKNGEERKEMTKEERRVWKRAEGLKLQAEMRSVKTE
jgi:hypothetical protein